MSYIGLNEASYFIGLPGTSSSAGWHWHPPNVLPRLVLTASIQYPITIPPWKFDGTSVPSWVDPLVPPCPAALERPVENRGPLDPAAQDPEQRDQVQKQLLLLLHALKCRQERQLASSSTSGTAADDGGGEGQTACNLPPCSLIRGVLAHMETCQDGWTCSCKCAPGFFGFFRGGGFMY